MNEATVRAIEMALAQAQASLANLHVTKARLEADLSVNEAQEAGLLLQIDALTETLHNN